MYLKFYEIWEQMIENPLGGDDSLIGETIFDEYNAMNPKNKLLWETVEQHNINPTIRACLTILKQRMSYFDDLYFNYQIVDTSEQEITKYIKPILRVIKRYSIGMIQDILNWCKKANLIADSNINELNNYLSHTTRTTTAPYQEGEDETNPVWTSMTKTNSNADIFVVPESKWNEFNSFSSVYHELSTIVYNIFKR